MNITGKHIAALLAATVVAFSAFADGGSKYTVCVGINKYALDGAGSLKGCVNDATFFRDSLVLRGGWPEANAALLVNKKATKAEIRRNIAAFAAVATAGDTFVFMQSSHGDYKEDPDDIVMKPTTDVAICAYDANYWDYELAEDLSKFATGVKVVVVVDACHSGGLFKRLSGPSFNLAQRVTEIIDERAALAKAAGFKKDVRKSISSSEIGWVTAAKYTQTSTDIGLYNTDGWWSSAENLVADADHATGDWPASTVRGSTFSAMFLWSWWSGRADRIGVGDGDGRFDAYEGWKIAYDFCTNLKTYSEGDLSSYAPQYLNKDVLRSVEFGVVNPDGAGAGAVPASFKPTTYALSLNPNGGSGTVYVQGFLSGVSAHIIPNKFKRSGYVFTGWAKSPTGAVAYKNAATVTDAAAAGATRELYAKWAKIKKTYKVKFYANGGKGKMAVQKFTYGKAKKLAANKFKRKGYTFVGWAKSKKGAAIYKDTKKVKNLNALGKTVKLYAVWRKANEFHWGYLTECSSLRFTTGGDAPWRVSGDSADDFYSARSGKIRHKQVTWLKTTVTGPGRLLFQWKSSCEIKDILTFYVDGVAKDRLAGNFGADWIQMDFNLKKGKHKLVWKFKKDSSFSSGSDSVWVDDLYWIPK